jgi:CRP/FNR family transcriptional regulator, cyclic AMP receptor protein
VVAAADSPLVTEINLFKHSKDAFDVESGFELFREGDAGDVMYFVLDGRVEVRRGGNVIETIGPGGIIGELALIDTTPRSATATAAVPSRLVRVGKQEFGFLVQEHPTFALQVMAVMAERLRRANDRVVG